MLNNTNYYRIKLEFAPYLGDFPEFIIYQQQDDYINVTLQPLAFGHYFINFSRLNSLQHYAPQCLIEQLFQELEKDYIQNEELHDLGRLVKNYLRLLKQIKTDQSYYTITPGLMAGFFIVLHSCLLLFPANRSLIYSSLAADFYGLGFWLFSVWSCNKHQQALQRLETQLIEKINFLTLLSPFSEVAEFSFASSLSSSLSLLPPYEEVLLEDAMRGMEEARPTRTVSENTSHFFYLPRFKSTNDHRKMLFYLIRIS